MRPGDAVTLTGTIAGLHYDAPEQFSPTQAQVAHVPTRVQIVVRRIDAPAGETIKIISSPIIDVELD